MHEFGSPDVLRYEDAPRPDPLDDDVLVRVHAAGVNPVDWRIRQGMQLVSMLPENPFPLILGMDVSGVVEEVGASVTEFETGDAVFGVNGFPALSSHAEYSATPAEQLAPKPESLDHGEAAGVPVVTQTAWQALFEYADCTADQRVLIHGAAGGVGHMAVQLAKWKGAEVIATASGYSEDYLRDLGVDEFVNRDPFSVPRPETDYVEATNRPTSELSVAYSPNLDLQPVASTVRETVDAAVTDLAVSGVTVDTVDVSLPSYEELSMAYGPQVGVFFSAFAQQVEDRYDIDFETADVEDTVRSTIALGTETDAADNRLQNAPRTDAYDGIQDALTGYDVLVTPTLTVPPFSKHLTDGYPTEINGQSVIGVPTDVMLTWVFNMTGHPVASVPAGVTDNGLPVGLQIIGRRFAEADILSVAAALERVRPWMDQYPVR